MTQALSPHICIIGGGFGGLYTALYLQKYRHLRSSQITLIEPKAQFLFTPMMYELITDELKEWEIAPTYSSLVAGKNIDWQQASADSVDLEAQTVTLSEGNSIRYDYLVIACGADSRPVDIAGVDEHTLTFRSLEDTQILRARLAQLVQVRSQLVHIAVVGGGPSGVELASKVADYLSDRNTPHQITLIERGDHILKPFPKPLRQLGEKALSKRNVTVLTQTSVQSVSSQSVLIERDDQPQHLKSDLTLWAVGTQPKPWLGAQSVEQNDRGQRKTRRSLQLPNYDNVFVLGDSADVRKSDKSAAPNTAQAAFQGASQVAKNLARMAQGKQPKTFNYLHLGDMITLGIGDAGLHSFGLTLGGQLAALSRRGVYIFRMPTRRHQVKVARRAIGELLRAVVKPFRSRHR